MYVRELMTGSVEWVHPTLSVRLRGRDGRIVLKKSVLK
jgi:hypothetical protein